MKRKWNKLWVGLLASILACSGLVIPAGAVPPANPNLARESGVTASGDNAEDTVNTAVKAVDGDYETRFASAQNTKPVLKLDLGAAKEIKFLRLYLQERTGGAAPPKNSVKKYQVTFASDAEYTKVIGHFERSLDQETIRDDVLLSRSIKAQYIKLEVKETHQPIGWDNAAITEFELYSRAMNFAQGTVATGTNTEAQNPAANAVDGNYESRCASNEGTNPTMTLDLGQERSIKVFKVFTERVSLENTPQNKVKNYKVTISADSTFDQSDTSHTVENMSTTENISTFEFGTAAPGRYVQLEILERNPGGWDNAAITEFELYDHGFTEITPVTAPGIDDVRPVYNEGSNTIVVPAVDGWTIESNGADFEQIVGKDFTVQKPLTEKVVNISLKKTNRDTDEVVISPDYPVTIPGLYASSTGNGKPIISPELAEWYSDSSENLTVPKSSRIVVNTDNQAALDRMANEFKADYEAVTGQTIAIANGRADSVAAGDFFFTLGSTDTFLGDEGYKIAITDKVMVEAGNKVGAYWSTRTILQMLAQSETKNTMPKGYIRDYPKYKVRGLLLDVARKPFSLSMVKDIMKNMAWHKMNDFQVHLSDNYIWLEDYGVGATEDEAFKAYDAFRLESDVRNGEGVSPTTQDYSYTKEEFRQFIQDSREIGMNIVPEIDVPAHANSFTKVFPEIKVVGEVSSLANTRPLIDHIDVRKPEAVQKIKDIFDDYTKTGTPTFDSQTVVHIGADEFLSSYTAYREFLNEIVPYIKETNTVRMWGGLTWIKDNPTTVIEQEAIENVEMNLWSKDWADGMEMYNMGYKLINTIDDYMYMVPNGTGNKGAYADYLNLERLYNSFEPYLIRVKEGGAYKPIPAGDPQMLGAAFAIWNDNIDKRASGLDESDMYKRFQDALPLVAEKTWANGKEKGSVAAVKAASDNVGLAPNTNPYCEESTDASGKHGKYTFAEGKETKDGTTNSRNLTNATNVTYQEGKSSKALELAGGASYVETPLDRLGRGNKLSFDMNLTEAKVGQILFEADSAYGTSDIRIKENGKLGFTRELYDYEFEYTPELNTWTEIVIKSGDQRTELFVDGESKGTAVGRFRHNEIDKKTGITYSSFHMPVHRIGSKTNSVRGKIDNVVFSLDVEDHSGKIDNSQFTAAAEHEQSGQEIDKAMDNNPDTHWHTTWGTNSLPETVTFTFDEPTEIGRIGVLPRQSGGDNGKIKKFDLFIKASDTGEEKKMVADQVWDSSGSWHFASLKPEEDGIVTAAGGGAVTAKVVKLVVKESFGSPADNFASAAEFAFYAPVEDAGDVPDKAALAALVEVAKALEGEIYTTSSFALLAPAIVAAEGTIADGNATQTDITETYKTLLGVVEALEKRGDTTALREFLASNSGLNEGDYTAQSWAEYVEVRMEAQAIVDDNSNAAQADVDKALANLQKAKEALEKKTVQPDPEKPVDPEKPADPGKPADPEKPANPQNPGAPNKPNAVKTGDSTAAAPFIMILVLALGTITGITLIRKKHKN